MHFHRDLLAVCDTFSRHVLRPTPDDVFTGTPPLAFTFGLGAVLLFPLHAGASTLLVERATPAELATLITEHGVTICSTAPTAYKAMLAAGASLPTLRTAVSAGEHLPAATWQAFLDATGIAIIDGIGSTEMLHIFIGSERRRDPARIDGSRGARLRRARARRRRQRGAGRRGRDDWRSRARPGAATSPTRASASTCSSGWNITGDTFTRDADGYFWYQARSDDMIISSGYNIAAPEVEEALLRPPRRRRVCGVGVPDEARGMLVKAYVVLADRPERPSVTELQDFVKAAIAPYKYPRAVEFVAELPRTATGKLQRFRLRDA